MFYNLGSLFFGLWGWAIPCIFLNRRLRPRKAIGILASLACSLLCVVLVLFSLRQEAFSGDFAAIEDTIHAFCILCCVQGLVSLLLNGILLGAK